MNRNPLNDAMPARPLSARWVIRGILTLQTAMHLGGSDGERIDMPVLRDPANGSPLLPGTTFAGALRNALADRLGGYGTEEPREIAILFGAVRDDDDGSQSPLIVFDAVGELPSGCGIEVRDGVAISPQTGVAQDGKKYDFEVLPAGTRFGVRVDLMLPPSYVRNDVFSSSEKALLEWLIAALDAFSHGENAFGARRSRGLGQVRAVWAAKRFALNSKEGWLEWVLSSHEQPFAANPDQPCIRNAIEAAAPDDLKPLALLGDARFKVVIDMDLSIAHDILVRSPGADPGAPDVSHLHSGGWPVLPGTSLGGVMRAQALRVARLIRGESDAKRWIDRLFGPRFEGRRPPPGHTPHASRLRVGEATLDGTQSRRQTRVAIDRFTQGSVDTALFDEQTEVGGRTTVRLELRNPHEGELGLVLLVVKDLLDGTLPVGGTSSVGRGVLGGYATVTWYEGDDGFRKPRRSARLESGKPPAGEAGAEINKAIQSFFNERPMPDEGLSLRQTGKKSDGL